MAGLDKRISLALVVVIRFPLNHLEILVSCDGGIFTEPGLAVVTPPMVSDGDSIVVIPANAACVEMNVVMLTWRRWWWEWGG